MQLRRDRLSIAHDRDLPVRQEEFRFPCGPGHDGVAQLHRGALQYHTCLAATRHYYIAAEDVTWNYAPSGRNLLNATPIRQPWLQLQWPKTRFVEYTTAPLPQPKPQPAWLGILGPVIRAEVGDEVVVDFLNRSHRGHDMHPHGLRYDKINEGSLYLPVAKGGFVAPGARYTYHWFANAASGPGRDSPVRSSGGITPTSTPGLRSTPACWGRSSLPPKAKPTPMDLQRMLTANLLPRS
jgi:hypothetical protein